jgi:hypothetical protein
MGLQSARFTGKVSETVFQSHTYPNHKKSPKECRSLRPSI